MGIYQVQLETYLGHVFDATTPKRSPSCRDLSSIREGVIDGQSISVLLPGRKRKRREKKRSLK